MNQETITSITVSLTLSFFISLFIFNAVKNSVEEFYQSIYEEMVERLNLPPDIPQKRVIRFCYFIFSGMAYIHLTMPSPILPPNMTIIAALLLPLAVCLLFSLLFLIIFEICGFIKDIILFTIYTPYKMYEERNTPGLKQFMNFYFYLLFLAVIIALIILLFFK